MIHNCFHYSTNLDFVKIGGESSHGRMFIVLDSRCKIEQLPTSLVKLVFKHPAIEATDLSYLTSSKKLVLLEYGFYFGDFVLNRILEGELHLPQSIFRLDISFLKIVSIDIHLPNLKELVTYDAVPNNITEQNFPSLKFIQLLSFYEDVLIDSTLSPTKLVNQGLIKSVKLIKNGCLVELSCFPCWIQYSDYGYFRYFIGYLIDIFSSS
ncbi:hypothetical protein P9112_006101 [Eukaryota sp. TZLM1-RC]